MNRYLFNWTITGSTVIEAATLAEAQVKFDGFSVSDLHEGADQSSFTQDQVLRERRPGNFTNRDPSAVIERASLDEEHQQKFTGAWLFDRPEGLVEFDTEAEACAAQREYRTSMGFNPITGE